MMGAVGSLGALCSMGDENCWRWPSGLMESSRERIIGLTGAVIGSMGATDGLLGALGSMGDANCWRGPDGLMGSSRERIIGLMGAVTGSMEATDGSLGALESSMGAVVGSMMGPGSDGPDGNGSRRRLGPGGNEA